MRIDNPSIPYKGPLDGGLKPGVSLYFKGKVADDVNRFAISLIAGGNIAMHFNPRFKGWSGVVFNTRKHRKWQNEEKSQQPFQKGGAFELLFIVKKEGYQVKVNENELYLFKHRIPAEQVTGIKIGGDVSIQTFDITEAEAEEDLAECDPGPAPAPPVKEIDSDVNPIYGGLRAGMSVYFKGTAPKDSNRFSINLHCGDAEGCDNAFHFNPRFDTNMVVFNTFRDGNWENEERSSEMPFSQGEEFEILYIITSEGYQVNVNGKAFHLFKHRMPVEDVTAIKVIGDVGIEITNIIQDGEGGLQGSLTQGRIVLPSTPYKMTIQGGLKVGMYLYFQGTVHRKINRFYINLQNGQKKAHGIALHFNPRFKPGQVVAFNTFTHEWKKEERIHDMPFHRGESFELVFIVTENGYQININGHQFYLFKHRMPVKNVNVLKIAGDVSMETINIVEGGQEGSQDLRKMRINKIPHVVPIFEGLRTGTYMYFQGTVPKELSRFKINLQYGQMNGSDKALHFNPRFKPSEVVVFNTFQRGKWENEERVNKMPFCKGEDFELLIIITALGYQVLINGRQFYFFKHRMPLEDVIAVKISGEVSMKTVNMIRGVQGALEGHQSLGRIAVTKIPHVGPIFGGLRTGMALFFRGTVPQEIKRFHINLQLGNMKGSDKALHFNPCFEPTEEVVFNSFRNGKWENEERANEMPFRKGEDFELLFIITAEGFQVNVNGRKFYLFKHRMLVEHVNAMKIAGDVTMQTVNITEAGKVSLKHPGLGKMVVNSVPFVGPISGGLKTGIYMYFRGKVPQEINRFHINLQCAEKKGCNKALHFNPQFEPSEMIVFNSFQNGTWKKEEKVHQMPFQKGEDFELVFIVTPKGYQVIVNGRPLHLFKHRMVMEHVRAVKIAGDVSMESVNLTGGGQERKIAVTGYIKIEPHWKFIWNKSIPHVGPIYGGLRTGVFMFFRGTVPQEINRFHINLQYGELKGCNKSLHFNPRLKPYEVVVFNSFRNGKWEKEEKVHEMPFRKGEDFEMAIMVTPKGYQVIINGRLFHLFKHRMAVEHVSALKIGGDVSIEDVSIIGGEDDDQKGHSHFGKLAVSKIPHVGPIHCGLRKGIALHFHGTTPDDVNRFHINLQFGEKDGSDVALHFNPRFKPYQVVVFNSFRKGRWEKEERPSEMPFRKGEDFHLVFLITSEGYQVFVNGEKFSMFKHRMPVEHVIALKIAGDVTMETVDINEGEDIPICPDHEDFSIPHLEPIPDSLQSGMSVFVKGKIPSKSKRFSINLLCGNQDGCDNALHLNPRFNTNVVVLNTFRNGRWENEERPSGMPFKRGEDFKLFINVTSEGYQVNVNGSPFHLFKHRIPVENVKAIKTVGDISLDDVDIIKEPEVDIQTCPSPQESIKRVGPLYGGLRTGMSVVFRGNVPDKSSRFSINLHCGQKEGCDNAFHFNPRFQSNLVVFNTFQNGNWGTEERPSGMPFNRGEDFELVYIITSEGYQVNVNGKPFHFFKHRIPLEQVRVINIIPDVKMQTANVIEGEEGKQGQLSLGKMVFNTNPYEGPISGGLRKGMYLYFRGTVHDDSNRFYINLQYGENKGKALHFNPRFQPTKVVVFNTIRNGIWEKEETVHEMPFHMGESFELVFIINSKGYQVLVNGRRFYMFKHRIPLKHVKELEIAGDVSVETLNMIEGGPRGIQGFQGRRKIFVPKIPHVEPIYGGLRKGMHVYFRGTVPKEVNRFHINLQCGRVKGSDIVLHFNPRFEPSEVVVFNTFRNGNWEEEERAAEMPFRKGEDFELTFFITSEGYQVNVNGRQFYLFKHRMPVKHVGALSIAGNVSMKTINMTGGGQNGKQVHPALGKMVMTEIPFMRPIYGGLRSGMCLHFKGTVPQDIKRFHINLQYGQMKGSNKALHLNPRFEPSEVVVFNTYRNGQWENEERPSEMPFRKGEDFELVIFVTSEGYHVNVNGQEFYLFKHRMPREQVSAIKVAGDVSMKTAEITEEVEEEEQEQSEKENEEKDVVPSISHVGPIYGGLRPGRSLHFFGTVPDEVKSFSINLHCGDEDGCDNAFHFNPRFDPSEMVVFNTFRNSSWENEERVEDMPFQPGDSFELVFIVTSEGYQVNVNGKEFYLFKHRIPLENVTAIKIFGDISIQITNIIVSGKGDVPGRLTQGKIVVDSIPAVEPLHRNLREGTYLYIRGKIDDDINSFHISLRNGDMKRSTAALHFNPRFQPTEMVVFNTFQNGRWGMEERVNVMPFRRGEDFELIFVVTSKGYQVIVNGRRFYLFKHRIPVEQMAFFKIAGDVSIESIDMTEGYQGLNKMVVKKIPHVEPIFGGLKPERYLYFQGTIPQEIRRFHINLQYGQMTGSDIALHLNSRFEPSEMLVFNSFRNGRWQKEERLAQMPFRKGEDFELVIFITSEGFQVNVNGHQLHLFNRRMPMEYVSAIKIAGDVSMKTIHMIGGGEAGLHPNLEKMVVTNIPHVGPVYGGLRPGSFVKFRGTVPEDVKRFHINLQYGQMTGSDKALHFNPRFEPSEFVLFNTFRNNTWENEERVDAMPFTKGENFEVVFMITSEGYQVKVNGRRFYFFKHCMPVEQVSAIKITGDVSIQTIKMTETGKGAPALPPPGSVVVNAIPHLEPIPGQLRKGMYLHFKGTVPQDAKRFHINLQNAEIKGCDKAFHFNPRFKPLEAVVFNTFRNGSWLNEERPNEMPFRKGEDFELAFIVTTEGYQVNVNGRQFYLYKHRMPVEEVSTVEIVGDVSIETIEMIEAGPEQPSLGKTVISKIPHVVPTYGGLRTGMYLYFDGTVPQEVKRFHINLQYGQRKGSNKALHLNPRFDPTEVVVFNSFRNEDWEEEERPAEMPFHRGEDFELLIYITSVGFQVNVNGRQFYLFKHRMPVEYVSAIKIAGDVSMKSLNIVEGGQGVEGSPGQGRIDVANIPHVGPIYGGLRPGTVLVFQGTVPEEVERFHINLQYGQTSGCDKALHFNPQFEPSGVVVFNTFRNGNWEEEERVDKMPFTPGENFELTIIVTSKGYKVIVNHDRFFFKHRMPMEQVSALKIIGNIFIQSVNMIKGADVEAEEKTDEGEEPEGGDGEAEENPAEKEETDGADVEAEENPDEKEGPEGGDGEAEENPAEGGDEENPAEKEAPVGDVEADENAAEKKDELERGDVDTNEKEEETGGVPEEEVISGELQEGMAVFFKGTVPCEISSFAVNLRCGDTKDSDIAFHFNPRFEQTEMVAFNSFKDGAWETEERVTEMPFRRGESFELAFKVLSEGYQVFVNRRPIFLFEHRIPAERVSSVHLVGDISMQVANYIDIGQLPVAMGPDDDTEISEIVMPISDSLKAGLSMSFQGTVPDDCTRFSINLQSGETNGCDTAIHFNPRFDTSEVVFNSFRDGSWETEEKVTEMPFTKGESFLLVFLVNKEGYEVSMNGRPLHMFKHRMPVEEMRALKIIGDVSIENFNIVEISGVGIDEELDQQETETIQSETPIPGTLKVGTSITCPGTIPAETKSFSINLQCGDTDGCDTALRFSPQFETSEVVLNSFENGSWQTEEKVDKMPFTKGEPFELVYVITEEGYQVNVNGTELCLFKHRIPVEQVKILQITGDVSIPTVNLAEGGEEYPSPSELGTIQAEIPIPDCLKAWVTLAFEGMVPADADRFCINLQCGETDGCDTAFHFSPQLDTSEVVFNSFREGCWQTEERVTEMPFRKGENFELSYIISLDGYQVNVNGQLLHFFKHHVAVEEVTSLQIIGCVCITGISITECAPSVTPLPSILKTGSSLVFQGTIPAESTSFSIDLQSEETDGCDTVFQLLPQFEPSEAVVFNSFQNGQWGDDERITEMPFRRGEDFELVYLITSEGYQVSVNGQRFYLFKHRIPVGQVKALLIAGNVTVPSLSIIEEGEFNTEETSSIERTSGAPFLVPIPGGFKEGMSVNFLGSIPEEISSFSVDLQCGEADGCDVALHFNTQFEPSEVVLFNSFKNGEWETEERVEQMPFKRGGKLDLFFVMTSEGYQVRENGNELHVFQHRIPLEQVSAMKIVGNITVESIDIDEGKGASDQMEASGCMGDDTNVGEVDGVKM